MAVEQTVATPAEAARTPLLLVVDVGNTTAGVGVPAVGADFGTATTFVIDARGRYPGGAIAPGVGISARPSRRSIPS